MIKRKLFQALLDHLEKKEITLIVGPRQAGKTTLMEMLRAHLEQRGERTLYLNLDIEWDRPHFETQASLVSKVDLEIGGNRGYVFIDEIQRKENAGLFLKGLYDLKLPYKFIASGSGSLELKEKIHESLVGRKRLFELSTLTFVEFVNYRTAYRYEDNLSEFFQLERDRTRHLLTEYMNFGGYPPIVLEAERNEKIRIIDDIYRSILEKDISYLLKVEKPEAFSSLIRVVASQVGNLINYSELSSTLNISYQTMKKYLWYAQKVFILDILLPYFRNVRKELSRSPVAYFNDLGFRNFALGVFGGLNNPAEIGFVFENLVYLMLKEKSTFGADRLHFWRTKDGAEVDFVLEKGGRLIPLEIKHRAMKKKEVSRAFRSFINRYAPDEAFVVNLDFMGTEKIQKTMVYFVPFWDLLFREF